MRDNKTPKKDTYLLCESAEAIYWHELEKPKGERDEALMSECLRIMQMGTDNTKKRSVRRSSSLIKRVAVIAACFVLFLALSTGVAAAMGINLWSLVFTGTNTGFEIQGTNSGEAVNYIDFDSIPEYSALEVSSFEEAVEKLHINPLNFDLTKQGYMIDNIYITKNDAMIELLITYMKPDAYVDVTVQVCNGGAHSAFVSELLGDYNPSVYQIAGHDVYAAEGTDSIVCWADGEYIYQLTSNVGADVLVGIVGETYGQFLQD